MTQCYDILANLIFNGYQELLLIWQHLIWKNQKKVGRDVYGQKSVQ